jgi:hypothetical protein
VEAELWIPVAGSMAPLGFLLIVLVLPWSKLGVGSGNTASKNKSVTSRSSLLEVCCKMDELLTGHGGKGERSPPSARFHTKLYISLVLLKYSRIFLLFFNNHHMNHSGTCS